MSRLQVEARVGGYCRLQRRKYPKMQYSAVQYSTVQYSAVTLRCAGAGVGGIIVKPGNATSTDYRVSQLS